ncbi:MAG: hypothetical protein JW953_13480 [Anaerolineae bacterium]|nr:hypothetical protein [Anaerolineae bacterium]
MALQLPDQWGWGLGLARGSDEAWYFMASRHFLPNRDFSGTLANPMPVTVDDHGNLSVNRPAFL